MSTFLKFSSTTKVPTGTAMVLSDLPSISTGSLLGNNSGGSSTPIALTVAQALTMLGISSGKTAISNASTSQAVTFTTAFANTNYSITCNMVNTTDTYPLFQPIDITAQSTTGFTATWNAAVNTANYSLFWQAIVNN